MRYPKYLEECGQHSFCLSSTYDTPVRRIFLIGIRLLGVRWGWIGADLYRPILSKIPRLPGLRSLNRHSRNEDAGETATIGSSGSERLDGSGDERNTGRIHSARSNYRPDR